jgi:hypothetical protein
LIFHDQISAIAKSSVIRSSLGLRFNALFNIDIPLFISQVIVYAHPRFLKTSGLFQVNLFEISKYLIASTILSFESNKNHFK